jgi:hypothetical protein
VLFALFPELVYSIGLSFIEAMVAFRCGIFFITGKLFPLKEKSANSEVSILIDHITAVFSFHSIV